MMYEKKKKCHSFVILNKAVNINEKSWRENLVYIKEERLCPARSVNETKVSFFLFNFFFFLSYTYMWEKEEENSYKLNK
jgi:hypothetical protein